MVKFSKKNLYIEDTFIVDICYSVHFFQYWVNILGKIYLLIADTGKYMDVFI